MQTFLGEIPSLSIPRQFRRQSLQGDEGSSCVSLFPLLFSEKEVERTLLSPLLSRPEVVAFFDGSHPSLHSPIPHPPSPTLGKGENRVAKEEQANLRRLSYLHRVSHKVIQQRILCVLIVCFYRHPVFINQELDTTVAAAASRVLGRVAHFFISSPSFSLLSGILVI